MKTSAPFLAATVITLFGCDTNTVNRGTDQSAANDYRDLASANITFATDIENELTKATNVNQSIVFVHVDWAPHLTESTSKIDNTILDRKNAVKFYRTSVVEYLFGGKMARSVFARIASPTIRSRTAGFRLVPIASQFARQSRS